MRVMSRLEILEDLLSCLDLEIRKIEDKYLIIENNINKNFILIEYQEEEENFLTTIVRNDIHKITVKNYDKGKDIYLQIGKLLNIGTSIYYSTMYRM